AILTSLATWVVPVGMFDSQEVQYQVDGQTKTRKVVDPHSFRILTNEAGEPEYHRVQLFTTGDERPGLMNFPFEGLTSGSKYDTAVGIIMFMLVIGGSFGIVMRTGTIRSEEHTSELQSRFDLVCRLLLEKKNKPRPQRRLH